MKAHDFVFQAIVPDSPYHWVIFCRRCGYVSAYGNESQDKEMAKRRRDGLPESCIDDAPLSGEEVNP